MRWKGLEMDWGDNKFNATVSQTLNPTNIKDIVQETRNIGANEMPLIFCNPENYEFVKQLLENTFGICNLVKTPYIEENIITVVTDANTKMDLLDFCGCKNFFNGE